MKPTAHLPLREYTALFPFGGSGGGALGFVQARAAACGFRGRFRILGGLDFDQTSCDDFTAFTGGPSRCVDIECVEPEDLIEWYGIVSPDVVFLSPPCKGSSRLLSEKKAATAKYRRMNRLGVVWIRAMLKAWRAEPPALIIMENVPGMPKRAAGMLEEIRHLLTEAGYVFEESAHCCGALGNLAQRRRRFLFVARHPERCPNFLYQPKQHKVRGVGEVLTKLPMPATLDAEAWGHLHVMPKLSWRNWLRLALIPAGGDWRDLEGVLQDRARREVYRRHAVQAWGEAIPAVTGPGGMGVTSTADPRVSFAEGTAWHGGAMGVRAWDQVSGTVTGGSHPSKGTFSVQDPRVSFHPSSKLHTNKHAPKAWDQPSNTVITLQSSASGGPAVADPRLVQAIAVGKEGWGGGAYGVTDWTASSGTVAGESAPSNGRYAVADLRIDAQGLHTNKHHVLRMDEASGAVIGQPQPSSGAPAVADERILGFEQRQAGQRRAEQRPAWYGVLRMEDTARTIAGNAVVGTGAYSVADHRTGWAPHVCVMTVDEALALDLDPLKPPPFIPVIVSDDGTWHRPMTLLELSALQGYPLRVKGKVIPWAGTRTQVAEHIGNSVPPPAARSIAEQMLITLLVASTGGTAEASTPVWVEPYDYNDEEYYYGEEASLQ